MALKKIVKEFQDFISRGSVVDLAVGPDLVPQREGDTEEALA